MKSELVFFIKEEIIVFLGNHGRPETKHYEFAAALIIHRFCEKQWGKDCWIGFRIRPEYSGSLPAYNSERQIGLVEITKLFGNGVYEDSPVDFVIAKRVDIKKAQGMAFQVKRFGIGRDKKGTDELVTYLNSFSKKYGKTDANLLICLDDWVKVDMEKLYAGFAVNNFPFNRILFTWIVDDMVYIQDVYPKGEVEQYPIPAFFHAGTGL